MIGALKEIGEAVLRESKDSFLDNLIEPVAPKGTSDKPSYLGIMEFNLMDTVLNVSFEEMDEETPRKYLWVGNVETANSPQDRLTTSNVDYLLSQTIPNLIAALPDGELKTNLLKIRERFFHDLGTQKGSARRYRFILNLGNLSGCRKDYPGSALLEKIGKCPIDGKSMLKMISQHFWVWVRDSRGISRKEVSLFTVRINGEDIRKFGDYTAYLVRKKQDDVFGKSLISVCHICGRQGQVSSDTTRLGFSYYITDKIGFSSELGGEKNFYKNLSFCRDCYRSLIISESFTKNFLSTRLASQSVYLIPEFILSFQGDIPKWARWLKASFEATLRTDGQKISLDQFGGNGHGEQGHCGREERRSYLFNILFWQQSQAEFKVLKLIKDISLCRLDMMRKVSGEISAVGKRLFGGKNSRWELWLNNIYYLFPVRADKRRNPYEFKKVLDFYDALFTGRKIDCTFLIQQFIRLARVCRQDQGEQFNLGRDGNGDQSLVVSMLKANLLLLYLERLDMLKGEWRKMDGIQLEDFPDEIRVFVQEMKYTAEQEALFGLGILVGEVGSAQFNARIKNKPILEKLDFQGMKAERLIRFSNEIFARLKQYKRLSPENERIFAGVKRVLDKRINTWTLNSQQNVFYILSGYAYRTNKIISSARNFKGDKGGIFDHGQDE
ncbi:MAG: type I-B CRISPR-associated protein Cas8b/Csh1 [bacterium]